MTNMFQCTSSFFTYNMASDITKLKNVINALFTQAEHFSGIQKLSVAPIMGIAAIFFIANNIVLHSSLDRRRINFCGVVLLLFSIYVFIAGALQLHMPASRQGDRVAVAWTAIQHNCNRTM